MKIGILIAGLSPYGAERAAARLAEGFKECGQDVRVFLTDTESEIPLSVPVISMLHGKQLNLLHEFLYAPVQYVRLHRAVKREKIDVLISFMERANIFNMLLPKNHHKVLSIRTYLSTGLKVSGVWRRIFTKFFYGTLRHRADLIGTVSHAAEDDFCNLFSFNRDKLFALNNPIDLEEMNTRSREEIEPSHRALLEGDSIVHVGRFTWDKGQWYLIRALPKILESVPGARLIFLGDGDMRDYLQGLVTELNLQNKVHFLGYHPNPLKFISRAKILVGSSTQEGFPNALVEAMACNTPIVSTDCKSGPRELLAPDTDHSIIANDIEETKYGLLVPPLDGEIKQAADPLSPSENCLAKAVIRMLQDESLRNKYIKLSPERIEAFKTPNIIAKWMKLLNKLDEHRN